jgi:phosphate transport system permease protein
MNFFVVTVLLLVAAYIAFFFTKKRFEAQSRIINLKNKTIIRKAKREKQAPVAWQKPLQSIPAYYGYFAFIWSFIPALALVIIIFQSGVLKFTLAGAGIVIVLTTVIFTLLANIFLKPDFKARKHVETWIKGFFIFCSAISVSITLLIFISVLFESYRFFEHVSVFHFLFTTEWSPQTAMRIDQAGGSGKFGVIPVFTGTLLITFIAMIVAVPFGLMSAIYLAEYAGPRFRTYVKPILEVLAGIPTVVYGYFAAITFGPFIRSVFDGMGISIPSESALAAGIVMGVMIIPFVMSLSDDVMSAVPRSLREGSLGLGATKSETIKQVVIPAALPGIMGAVLLAISRAIGETMIVVMAAGLTANLTLNPLESVTTATVQIVKLLVGDQEFDSAKTLAAFALSLTLFVITLLLNIAALLIVKKYRERYE